MFYAKIRILWTWGFIENICNDLQHPSPPHTQTHSIESKDAKNNTLECKEIAQIFKISHVKNVNKSKNRLKIVKKQKQKSCN